MIGVSSAAQAGGEKDDSSAWALANILHGLANALNGPGQRADAAAVLAKLCGALSAALSLRTLHSCCTFDASLLHPLQVLTLQSAVSSCPRDVL